jgi:hypothetical protein
MDEQKTKVRLKRKKYRGNVKAEEEGEKKL